MLQSTKACLTSQIERDGVYPGATSRRVIRQTEKGRSSQRLRGWRGVTHPARFQGSLTGFMRLPAAFNRGSDLNREPQPSLDTVTGNVATLTTRPPRRRLSAVFGGALKWRRLRERKKNAAGTKNRTRVARLTDGHTDHSATTSCWRRAQTYAMRTKSGSFKGGYESPHRVFAAALTKDPTTLNRHLKQHAAVKLLPRQRLSPGFHDVWGNLMLSC